MPVLSYTLLRILLLLSFGGLAFALGMRGILLLVVAFVGSGIVSLFVLRSVRERAGTQVGGVFQRLNNRIDAAAAAEDAPTPSPASDSGQQDANAAADGTSDAGTATAETITLPNTSADQRTADSPQNS